MTKGHTPPQGGPPDWQPHYSATTYGTASHGTRETGPQRERGSFDPIAATDAARPSGGPPHGHGAGQGSPAPVREGAGDPRSDDSSERSNVIELLEKFGSVLVPVGLTLYAVLYLGLQDLYWEFGITPEQAGIDQGVLLSRLLYLLVMLLLIAVPAAGVIASVIWGADRLTRGKAGQTARRVWNVPFLAPAVAAVWCGAMYWTFPGFPPGDEPFIPADQNANAPGIVIPLLLGASAFTIPLWLMRRRGTGRAFTKVSVIVLTVFGLGFVLIGKMSDESNRLWETGEPSQLLNLLGFQDQWVYATGGEKDKPLKEDRPLLLLGTYEGAYVLYDCKERNTFMESVETTKLNNAMLNPAELQNFDCELEN